eukprot:GHVL01035081.1.p1 GENE.GHVL01035081.1~~GHVL01035081.1.p1  ORF type:complete len:651 (+),score=145.49 GHVL01035081.1:721-2673(+)
MLNGCKVRAWWPATVDPDKTDFSCRYWPAKITQVNPHELVITLLYDNGDSETVPFGIPHSVSATDFEESELDRFLLPLEIANQRSKKLNRSSSRVPSPPRDNRFSRLNRYNILPSIEDINLTDKFFTFCSTVSCTGNESTRIPSVIQPLPAFKFGGDVDWSLCLDDDAIRFEAKKLWSLETEAKIGQPNSPPRAQPNSPPRGQPNTPARSKRKRTPRGSCEGEETKKKSSTPPRGHSTPHKGESTPHKGESTPPRGHSTPPKIHSTPRRESTPRGKLTPRRESTPRGKLTPRRESIPSGGNNKLLQELSWPSLCVGEFCEMRDPEERWSADPCAWFGLIVKIEEVEPVYLVKLFYQDESECIPVSSNDIRRTTIVPLADWRDRTLDLCREIWLTNKLKEINHPHQTIIDDNGDLPIAHRLPTSAIYLAKPLQGYGKDLTTNKNISTVTNDIKPVINKNETKKKKKKLIDENLVNLYIDPNIRTPRTLARRFKDIKYEIRFLLADLKSCPVEYELIRPRIFARWLNTRSRPDCRLSKIQMERQFSELSREDLISKLTIAQESISTLNQDLFRLKWVQTEVQKLRGMLENMEAEKQIIEMRQRCCICLDKPFDVYLKPCGHSRFCSDCAQNMKNCALCRKHVTSFIKLNLSD